ncbi:sulfite exporter TauE/SafE family protein [Microbacterium soli]|uniref:Probable membrane transporter protein n=1 Tax=Microbacterium soli TaxID=446075 RepID=A0ABP7NJA7_9MICO
MSLASALALVAAGFGAGVINTVIGSGSLISYPAMVLLGLPPVSANIANTVGLVPGSVAGAWAYRRELRTIRPLLLRLGAASAAGAMIGATLLTVLPPALFQFVVPVLILGAALLVFFQRRIIDAVNPSHGTRWLPLLCAVFAASVYGGYFSAAQGVILLAVLGLYLAEDMQVQNALKNLLQCLVNVVAAIYFAAFSHVAWTWALWVGIGAVLGALVGYRLARRLPARVFRIFIAVFGTLVAVVMAYLAFNPIGG